MTKIHTVLFAILIALLAIGLNYVITGAGLIVLILLLVALLIGLISFSLK